MRELIDYRRSIYLSVLALPLGVVAELRYRRMPYLASAYPTGHLPAISVIIPARNEASRLPYLLSSLFNLQYPGSMEVLVVDDHSCDPTAAVARAYRADVLRLEAGLPNGWLGKPHACHRGALIASGEWLLFTDADTIHSRDGIARAVAYAVENNLDGLSLFIHQESKEWSDRLTLSVAYAGLFAGQRPSNHMLNGQFILISRRAYLESGGFEAVRNEALEDVAFGNHLYRLGYQVPVMRGEDIAQVQMYRDRKQLFMGMSRLASSSLKWEGSGALLTVSLITGLISPLIVLIGAFTGRVRWRWLPLVWGSASLTVYPWARRFGGAGWSLLAPLGALLVQIAGVYGLVNRLLGRGVLWKDRRV